MQARQKRPRPTDGDPHEPPASVQKLGSSASVQEAWNILLTHGMTPNQINLLHSRALAAQAASAENQTEIISQKDASATLSKGPNIGPRDNTEELGTVLSRDKALSTIPLTRSEGNPNTIGPQIESEQFRYQKEMHELSREQLASRQDNCSDIVTFQSSPQTDHIVPTKTLSRMNSAVPKSPKQHADSKLCETCSQNHEVRKLHETIEKLQSQITQLQSEQELETPLPPRLCILHRVYCECGSEDHVGSFDLYQTSVFLDPPRRVVGDKKWHLQGYKYAPAPEVLLDQHPDIVILIYKDYKCKTDLTQCLRQWGPKVNKAALENQAPISSCSESMMLSSYDLVEALHWAMNSTEVSLSHREKLPLRIEIKSPYHSFYHSREKIRKQLDKFSETNQELVRLFVDYIEESFEDSFADANILFSQGLVSTATLHYLFEPKMNVIHRNNGAIHVFRTTSWLDDVPADRRNSKDVGILRCFSFGFDGHFIQRQKIFTLEWPGSPHEVQLITSLEVYPLKYAESGLEDALSSRGEKFWACRKRRYVSYVDPDFSDGETEVGARYMIDTVMNKQFNPDAYPTYPHDEHIYDSALPSPPSRGFFLLLPPIINGYSMQLKKWLPLKVVHIEPVIWNLEAFESLVVDEDTKTLVKALVTNQLAKEKSTDLISGKGNGLIILLHGGPGTGKTLTAESVAELAKKPLYRVTCGDIGTNADAIDKHLQKVLYLGRLWGCVVLLDEADVFLEERSLADMQRNALVSVFLRVLEYYDGILVLTSNRVGTFDEAFKSRIQLSLHYENLTRTQRRVIWANFFKRLEKIEPETVDTSSLYRHLDDLAIQDMNGRQIRNSLTTARQLAMYQEKKMDYGVLKHVIAVASKFDHYVKSVKHGITDDELAREGGVR